MSMSASLKVVYALPFLLWTIVTLSFIMQSQ